MKQKLKKLKQKEWNGELPSKVYCKYCYKNVRPELGDGVVICSECGYGLAPFEGLEEFGSYNAYEYHTKLDFIRFNRYMNEISNNSREPNGMDKLGIVPYICPICKKEQATIFTSGGEFCHNCQPKYERNKHIIKKD